MATFREGNWVQITPNPDNRWEYWTKEHTALAGMIGKIEEIEIAPDDPSIKFARIVIYDSSGHAISEQWFLERHLILSSQYDKVLDEKFKKACDDLQIWERKKKEILNNSLKRAFGLLPRKDSKKTSKISVNSEKEDDWEEVTDEIDQALLDDISESDVFDGFEFDGMWDGPDGTD